MKVVFDGNIWNQYSIVWLSEMTEQSVQATLWRNFFGHLEQQVQNIIISIRMYIINAISFVLEKVALQFG